MIPGMRGMRLGAGMVLAIAALAASSGVAAGDELPEFSPPGPSKSCPYRVIQDLNGGGLMDIDVFGRPAPGCRFATKRLRMAARELPAGSWGRIGHWRCIWQPWAAACKRDGVTLYATNPGA
jgi:hypothetical protein